MSVRVFVVSNHTPTDTACVELKYADGSMIAIDTIAVENEFADNVYQRSELDYLIYNDPAAYADLILNGDPEAYLNAVTEYKPLIINNKATTDTHTDLGCGSIKLCITPFSYRKLPQSDILQCPSPA